METLSTLLVPCERNIKGPVLRSFDIFIFVNLNKLLMRAMEFSVTWTAMMLMWRYDNIIDLKTYQTFPYIAVTIK